MKHTPGPWEVSNGDIWTEGGQIYIAVTMGVPMGDSLKNAHLIAAAPEMYELLVSIENDAGQVSEWLWNKIQTVLQKARGESERD